MDEDAIRYYDRIGQKNESGGLRFDAMLPWISVTETMPEPKDEVIFWATDPGHPEQNRACMGYWDSGELWMDNAMSDRDGEPMDEHHVTHWFPIIGPSKAHQ